MTLRTLESLGSLAGKRVIVRCDLNVPLKDGAITDDGRVRASLPTLNALIDQGARVVVISHLGRPDGAPDAKYSLAPVAAAALASCSASRVAFATTPSATSADEAVAGLERRRGRRAREPAVQPGGDQRRTPTSARLRRAARRASATRSSPTASASCTASRRASTSSPSCCRAPPALLIADRARGARQAHREPRAALHGRARRLEGLRQARRHRPPAAAGRHAAHRRRHALHLPRGPGPQGRREPARGRPDRHGHAATSPRPSELGVEIVLPTDVVVASKFGADAEHVGRAGRRASRTPPFGASGLGLDIGPDTAAAVRRGHRGVEDRVLERPDGRVRARALRGRHARPSPRRSPRSTASASSAAATRPPPSAPSASPTTSSATSPPVAAPASNSSRASGSPDWRSSDGT